MFVVVMPPDVQTRYAPFVNRHTALRVARWYGGVVVDRITGVPIKPTRIERLVGWDNKPAFPFA
jgi:hypothetical protein